MGKKSFIDKQKATHFHIVHRSQRDPKIADENASKLVLKQVAPSKNLLRKGNYNPDVANLPDDHIDDGRYDKNTINYSDSDDDDIRLNTKEDPTNYGIFFDDVDKYDYSKHLKPIGDDPSAVYIESNPTKSTPKKGIDFILEEAKQSFSLPSDVFASETEDAVGLLNRGDGNTGIGLDLDPRVRQTLLALEDEAFIDEDLDDDFFKCLDGDTLPDDYVEEVVGKTFNEQEGWFNEYQKFKNDQSAFSEEESDDEISEEESKTATKSYRKAKTHTTNYSMTSSSIYRTSQLTLLDDRFDVLLEKEYEGSESDTESENSQDFPQNELVDSALDELYDNFLEKTDIIGRRLMQKLTPSQQLQKIRDDLKADEFDSKAKSEFRYVSSSDEKKIVMPSEKVRDNWDCETILSTYSNIYNHPKFIRETTAPGQIRLGKDGVPVGAMKAIKMMKKEKLDSKMEKENEEDYEVPVVNKGIPRSKTETLDEKKQRKEQIKQERRERRAQKKNVKGEFKKESKRQEKVVRIKGVDEGVVSLQ